MEGGALRRPLIQGLAGARSSKRRRHSKAMEEKRQPIFQPWNLVFARSLFFSQFARIRRKRLPADEDVAQRIINAWEAANFWRVGRYVIMPDHIHLFCAPNTFPPRPLKNWIAFWKNQVTRAWSNRDQLPIWQRDFWDRQLRRGESYTEKWEYVKNNPGTSRFVHRSPNCALSRRGTLYRKQRDAKDSRSPFDCRISISAFACWKRAIRTEIRATRYRSPPNAFFSQPSN